jgi:hypothetical protein
MAEYIPIRPINKGVLSCAALGLTKAKNLAPETKKAPLEELTLFFASPVTITHLYAEHTGGPHSEINPGELSARKNQTKRRICE